MRKSLKIKGFSGLAVLLLAGFLAWVFTTDNFHTVIPNQIYRSAELSEATMDKVVEQNGIKTIINLEGSSTEPWYLGEITVSEKYKLHHYNMELNAHKMPRLGQLRHLVNLLQTAPRPILIHCHRGADRTGMASALALILAGDTLKDAKKQYSFRYLVSSPSSIGKQVIPLYSKWLKKNDDEKSSRLHFLQWLGQLQKGVNYPATS